jgi:hypothetical protein
MIKRLPAVEMAGALYAAGVAAVTAWGRNRKRHRTKKLLTLVIGAGLALTLGACGSGTPVKAAAPTKVPDQYLTPPAPATTATTLTPATTTPPAPLPLFQIMVLGKIVYSGREPVQIDYSADAGNIVDDITWSSWTATQAVGSGTWEYENCIPDCASSTHVPYPATITLSDPINGVFYNMTETTSGPQGFTNNYAYPGNSISEWALGAS